MPIPESFSRGITGTILELCLWVVYPQSQWKVLQPSEFREDEVGGQDNLQLNRILQ